jgi:ribosomal protein S18 acetylase RimI-like enzyme
VPPENKRKVAIVDYSARYGDAFQRLNIEWLEKYFEVEPIDRRVLSDPEQTIIAPGGIILYACVGTEVVGTVALKYFGNGVYELTKMAVTENQQGLGIGRQLLCAVVEKFHQLHGKMLYLESHSDLVPAITLYESAGFRHETPPSPSDYARANVFMVYRRAATPST